MLKWSATPLEEVNGVKFGMLREEVRKVLGNTCREFRKNKFSKNTTDDFGVCHVFYNQDDRCEAVEVFDRREIIMEGKAVFPLDMPEVTFAQKISCIFEPTL